MTDPTGPACGNNPNYEFRAYLADRAALRDRIAAALLARIKQATVSKAQPHDAITSLLAANEYDLADAVLAVLPAVEAAPVDRAAEAHRLALSETLGLGTGAPWDTIRDRAAELEQQAAIDTQVMEKADRECNEHIAAGRAFRQLAEQTQAWGQQESDRATRYRARLDRVRAECDTLMAQVSGLNPSALAGRRDAVARIREAARPIAEPAAETPQPESQATVLLSSRCDACRHTLNWHRNDVGCTVALCVCSRFQPPTEDEPAVVVEPGKEA